MTDYGNYANEVEVEPLAHDADGQERAAEYVPLEKEATPGLVAEAHDLVDQSSDADSNEDDEPCSRVREVLETSNAWNALLSDSVVRPQVRYTEEGVEGDRHMAPELRARLYLLATAVLRANEVQYDAEHEGLFYVREASY